MWKKIDERYSISDEGDVFDHKLNVNPKKCISNCGYYRVSIHGRMTALHRLVALHFIDNPENKPNINHKDDNRTNNHFSNLEWCTQKENIQYSYRYGRLSGRTKISVADLRFIIEALNSKSHSVKELANMFNVKTNTIYAYIQGRNLKRLEIKV